jgi:hypothetical protein
MWSIDAEPDLLKPRGPGNLNRASSTWRVATIGSQTTRQLMAAMRCFGGYLPKLPRWWAMPLVKLSM